MKKLVLSLVAVAAFGFTANAQETEKPTFGFQESNVFVEGAFQINDVTVKPKNGGSDIKTTEFNFTPKVGYMLSDKFAVGVELGFGKLGLNSFEGFDGIEGLKGDHVNTTYAGAFGRYYFLEVGRRFKTFAEVGIGYNEAKIRGGVVDVKATGIKTGVTVGFNYFVTEKIALGFNMGDIFFYENYNVKTDGTKVATVSNTKSNLNIFNNFFDNAKFSLTYKF
ncbi:outer membrane beta-barrel protein [Myroides profundi]|uniref:Outer membrane protein n=1 Tax=Myroides profundi TaxID=480520 RepID=A0AAJ4W2C3_MYRPR|nr:outer membrane beta-barrel protein [Myroides profundi]AJH14059.1 hypothetical protein MPR_0868 [Myroides profundi]SEQ44365.1 outer membrane protein [Myroides profundi]